jgi:hypothetical protein
MLLHIYDQYLLHIYVITLILGPCIDGVFFFFFEMGTLICLSSKTL